MKPRDWNTIPVLGLLVYSADEPGGSKKGAESTDLNGKGNIGYIIKIADVATE